ncbi:STN domain-containing protein [Microbacteriaceae bacterium K1510]|nr:STN domain-containing protein [Microbacteriaceae bacterium K1510]
MSSARPTFAQSSAGERTLEFSIPSQPLAAAIEAYSAATGLQVFYDGYVASDRRSTAVSGILAPDVALRILLEGTNLEAVYAGSVFAVVPATRDGRIRRGPGSPGYQPYFATIQHSIEQAFCRNPQTAPGDYRIALRFRIGFSGEVLLPELLHSTGDAQRDDVIVALLRGLNLSEPPPPNLPQPVTMLISPRPRAQTGDCSGAGAAAPSLRSGP